MIKIGTLSLNYNKGNTKRNYCKKRLDLFEPLQQIQLCCASHADDPFLVVICPDHLVGALSALGALARTLVRISRDANRKRLAFLVKHDLQMVHTAPTATFCKHRVKGDARLRVRRLVRL